MDHYQVFISCKSSDNPLAMEVFNALNSTGLAVFYSVVTLEEKGVSIFKQAIDKALEECNILIVVGTSRSNLESRWVFYEWNTFQSDILSGNKPEGKIFVCVKDLEIKDLPPGLRSCEVFQDSPKELARLRKFVTNALTAEESIPQKDEEVKVQLPAARVEITPNKVSQGLALPKIHLAGMRRFWAGLLALFLLIAVIFLVEMWINQGQQAPGLIASLATGTQARTPTPPFIFKIRSTQVSPKDGMVEVSVPASEFLMGSDKNKDSQAGDDETPQHTVYQDAFWIDQTEVTNAQYARCVASGQCTSPQSTKSDSRSSYYGVSQFANYPVIYVDWNQAQTYCAWAGRRLPSEAEWEKAARGTDGRIYPWGDTAPDQSKLNFNQDQGDTTAVGSYPSGASFYEALDMAGNVSEWVNDWYSDSYYQQSPARNPPGPTSAMYRVVRGGSWNNYVGFVRSAYRDGSPPGRQNSGIGFRCAASP